MQGIPMMSAGLDLIWKIIYSFYEIVRGKIVDQFQEHKKTLEKAIGEAIATALEKGNLSQEGLSEISDFILERIDKIQNHEELIKFVSDLSQKWPIFKNLELIEKGEAKEEAENTASQDVSNLLKGGKIDEAIDLAQKIMEK